MARLLMMPEVAANATEAVLQEWQVEVDSPFDAQDTIATVETEKAVVDVEADNAGVILATLVENGAQVEVGSPIALLGEQGETVADVGAELERLGVSGPPESTQAVRRDVPDGGQEPPTDHQLSGAEDGADGTAAQQDEDDVQAVHVDDDEPDQDATTDRDGATGATPRRKAPARAEGERVFASPLARRLAREAGLDVADLSGTGPRGRVLRRDVEAGVAQAGRTAPSDAPAPTPADEPSPTPVAAAAPAPAPVAPAAARSSDVSHTRMRRAIARRLGESKQTVPHFYLRATARSEALVRLRAELNDGAPVRVSLNDLVVKAAARAHVLVPEMNVVWTDDALRFFSGVDVAVAVATGTGLLTPVLRGADRLTVTEVGARTRDLAERAKAGRLKQDELEGGSFSVTNLGMFGTEEFAAIINPPQSAILAVGAVREEPVVQDGVVVAGSVLRLTLSVDHRAVDGVLAARWMQTLVGLVERPLQILA